MSLEDSSNPYPIPVKKPIDRRAFALELANILDDCRGCNNKAKKDCTNGCCKTCCKLAGKPCLGHMASGKDEETSGNIKNEKAPGLNLAPSIPQIPTSLMIGKQVNGCVDQTFENGYQVSVLVNGIVFSGILFEDNCTVQVWKLPNDLPLRSEQICLSSQSTPPLVYEPPSSTFASGSLASNQLDSSYFDGEEEQMSNLFIKDVPQTTDQATGPRGKKRRYVKSGLYSQPGGGKHYRGSDGKFIPSSASSSAVSVHTATSTSSTANVEPVTKKTKRRPAEVPKGPRSAYVYFQAALRARLKTAPSSQHSLIVQQFDWHRVSEKEKLPYKQFALSDKKRYEKEMEEWRKQQQLLQQQQQLQPQHEQQGDMIGRSGSEEINRTEDERNEGHSETEERNQKKQKGSDNRVDNKGRGRRRSRKRREDGVEDEGDEGDEGDTADDKDEDDYDEDDEDED